MKLSNHLKQAATLLIIALFITQAGHAKSIAEFTQGMQKQHGFFDFYWDEGSGKIWLKIDQFNQEFLYVNYLQSGVGSNDIGLDRGQPGRDRVVKFIKIGPKVLLLQPNLDYRAYSNNPSEIQAVEDAFAQSILWAEEIVASSGNSVLVDANSLLLTDSHQIKERLKQLEQGDYSIDQNRSAIYLPNSKSFPDNTEFEAIITLSGSNPGDYLRSVVPTNEIITVRTHHSFIKLPPKKMSPRNYDPRSGAIYIEFKDYAVPLNQDMHKKWVVRHRLEKKFPNQAVSDPIKPIIYYLDPGTPEPVKSALIDGARWWEEGFKAIGFSNAFKVKLLPIDADPLDIRYNTIQWVHRSTRGWSYGSSIVDPRSGEILKGHVTLGSLRVRQDMLVAQGLLSPFKNGDETPTVMQEVALARLRQLSAHEVGHTLGLIHNFYASSNNRASVMDYPHPLVKINAQGEIDLQDAYAVGIGAWDKASLAYLYTEFSDHQQEKIGLTKILQDARHQGLGYIADRDARAKGGSHPYAHLWDNGADPVAELLNILKVREKALSQFGENTIPTGQELFYLEQILVPVYLFHRYQTEAAVKLIAGVDYQYALRGDTNSHNQLVSAEQQRAALTALMKTLHADQLAIPQRILSVLLPPPEGSNRHREHFKIRTGLNFDPIGAAEGSARHTLALLLHPQRSNRLLEHHARNASIPSLNFVIETLLSNTWQKTWKDTYLSEIQRSINWATLQELFKLAANEQSSPQTKAITVHHLKQHHKWLQSTRHKNEPDTIAAEQAARDIEAFIKNGQIPITPSPIQLPPGSPIGG